MRKPIRKVRRVILPEMGEVASHQNYVAITKVADAVTNKLGATATFKIDQFQLFMIMPAVVDIWQQIAPCAKGMCMARCYG